MERSEELNEITELAAMKETVVIAMLELNNMISEMHKLSMKLGNMLDKKMEY